MQKKTSTAETFIAPNVKLTREDLDEILEIFRHNLQNVTIEDDKFTYDSLDELKQQHGNRVGYLAISGTSPHSVFVVNHPKNKRARIETARIEPWSHGYHSIKSLLEERQRFKFPAAFQLGTVIFVLLFTLIMTSTATGKLSIFPGTVLALLLMAAALMLGGVVHFGGLNFVTLQKRHELENFWTRNKDKVWLLILAALVGLFFSYLPKIVSWIKTH